ncbi:MAG: DUF6398 domain-containing protein [Promethearchaeota archaeon]
MSDRTLVKEKMNEIILLTSRFCDDYLDDEYKQLCKKLVHKMSRKHNVPFLRGRLDIWAASVIHALGQINFLFDQNTKPYVSAEFIANYFNTSTSTTGQKAKKIRDLLRLRYFDKEFSTNFIKEQDPFSKMVSINGFIIPKKLFQGYIQEIMNKGVEKQIIKEYREYREQSNSLIKKIMDIYINKDVLYDAGNVLGIIKNNEIYVRNFEEQKALVDFSLFDYKTECKSFIVHYEDQVAENEAAIWKNLLAAYTSLFEVKSVLRNKCIIILKDLLNENSPNFKLIDLHLSQTIFPKALLFARVIPFKNLKISSGVNFVFQSDFKDLLIEEYHKLAEKGTNVDPEINIFISFFELNRKYGLNVISLDVN